MVDAKIDWRIMTKLNTVVTAKTYEEQEAVFLALEVCNVLEIILEEQGWKPTQDQLARLEQAVITYVLSYKNIIEDITGEWNVVLGNYILKRIRSRNKGVRKQENKKKKQLDKALRILFKEFQVLGVMELIRKAPVFSIIITSYIRDKENEKEKTTLTRTNTVKYSYGYGNDHKKVFVEVKTI